MNDGGQAFPVSDLTDGDGGVAGMSLLDYFAAQVANGLASDSGGRVGLASDAYSIAADMLAEREKRVVERRPV